MATTETTIETLTDWRVSQLEELGFSKDQSIILERATKIVTVNATDKKPVRRYTLTLDWHTVRGHLDAGATHEQIMRIYAD